MNRDTMQDLPLQGERGRKIIAEETLILNTDVDKFAGWLAEITEKIAYRPFPTREEEIHLQRARWSRTTDAGNPVLEMEGFCIIVREKEIVNLDGRRWSKRPVTHLPDIGVLITFKVIPLASERIEVQAQCLHPAVKDYFQQELLAEIEKRWPEARGAKATAPPRPHWFPKKRETLARWKRAYSIIKELDEKYRELCLDGQTDDPNPQILDYIDAFVSDSEVGRKYTGTRIRQIRRAGDKGWLE